MFFKLRLFPEIERSLNSLATTFARELPRVAAALETIASHYRPPQPGRPQIVVLRQVPSGESFMLQFKITLPALADVPEAKDVAERSVSVSVNGSTEQHVGITDLSVLEVLADEAGVPFTGNAGDSVVVKLVDIDASKNPSPAREQTFTLADTIAPPEPGEMGLAVTGQI